MYLTEEQVDEIVIDYLLENFEFEYEEDLWEAYESLTEDQIDYILDEGIRDVIAGVGGALKSGWQAAKRGYAASSERSKRKAEERKALKDFSRNVRKGTVTGPNVAVQARRPASRANRVINVTQPAIQAPTYTTRSKTGSSVVPVGMGMDTPKPFVGINPTQKTKVVNPYEFRRTMGNIQAKEADYQAKKAAKRQEILSRRFSDKPKGGKLPTAPEPRLRPASSSKDITSALQKRNELSRTQVDPTTGRKIRKRSSTLPSASEVVKQVQQSVRTPESRRAKAKGSSIRNRKTDGLSFKKDTSMDIYRGRTSKGGKEIGQRKGKSSLALSPEGKFTPVGAKGQKLTGSAKQAVEKNYKPMFRRALKPRF